MVFFTYISIAYALSHDDFKNRGRCHFSESWVQFADAQRVHEAPLEDKHLFIIVVLFQIELEEE